MQSRFARPPASLLIALVFAAPLLVALFALGGASAQDGVAKSRFVTFLENSLSTPDRRIELAGVADVFSWNPRVERITISDREGAWLELEGVEIVWTRSALFQRVLDIDVLRASRVTMLRKPVVPEPAESGGGFSGPPLEIVIDSLALPQIVLAAPVVGGAAELSASGSARLTEEELALQLSLDRQDRAGSLVADLRFEPASKVLAADLKLEEPANGLLAELLGLRSKPALAVSLWGTGPLDEWQANLDVQANETRVVSGAMSITRVEGGHRVFGKLAAALETLVPEDYSALLAGESGVDLDLLRAEDGTISVSSATLRSEGVDLAASGVLSADLIPQQAKLSLSLGQAGRAELPFLPGDVSLASLLTDASLDGGATAPWSVEIAAKGVESGFGRAAELLITASGEAENLTRPASRSTSFNVEASANGVEPADPGLRDALGPTLELIGAGAWRAGTPVAVDNLQIALSGASATFEGTATRESFEGTIAAAVGDLSRFMVLAGRPLAGGADLKATGTATLAGAFDLTIDGATTDLRLGVTALDPFLAGSTLINGDVARSDGGLAFEGLSLSNERATVDVSGTLGDPALDLTVSASVADLKLVTPRAAGSARVNATLSGSRAAPQVEAEATGENVVLMGRSLEDASARFSGVVAGPETAGEAEMSGTLGGAPVRGSAKLAAGENGARALEDLVFSVGESRIEGDLTVLPSGLLAGAVKVVSPDLSKVAPLFLEEASGMLSGDITLTAEGGAQSATFSATTTDLVYRNVTLESAEITGEARNLFRAPQLEGDFSVRTLNAGGLTILQASGTARREGEATTIDVDARLADGSASLKAMLAPSGAGLVVAVENFSYSRPGIDLALAEPATISVSEGAARFDRIRLSAGGGGDIALSGEAGSILDLSATLSRVPAALANSFLPNLGASGTISGTVTASGPAAKPNASFELTLADASVAASRNAGVGAVAVSAEGALANNSLDLRSRITGADNLVIDVAGTVGTASGAPLALRVTGSVPLSLGNTLAERGAALEGLLNVDVAVAGTASAPTFSGRVTSEGAGFVDPKTGIQLRNLSLVASVSGDRIVVERLTATSGEGNVSATGSIGLRPGEGFPVDLTVQVRQARYVDGTLVASRFDADLKLSGRFADGPLLEGAVFLDRTEITVPEKLPRNSVAVDVEHVAAPPPVERTIAISRQGDTRGSDAGGQPAGIRLDVTINAPQQIFVRGRGLDVELGGSLRLIGPISAVNATGAFQMQRGRLDILTQRIAFDSTSSITFAGDLDPSLAFTGTTRSGDVDITVTVTGRASDPEVIFSSVPELPQDEILAHLIFSKGIGELSPLQVARLAAAVSELSGGSGGVLGRLRATTGLDDLDIVTDEKGDTAVAAGRYVSENVYIGVQQGGTTESSRVTIDLDVTKNVKARAGMSAEGESSLGIFFEREY